MSAIIQPGSPIEFQVQQQDIERQRALALMLQQQAMTPDQGQMVSGHYIAPSMTQNLARLAQGLTGKSMQESLSKKQLEVANQQNKFMGDQAEQLAYATTPRAAVPGQTFTTGDPSGMGPVGTAPGTEAYNPGEREMTSAMIKYLNNVGQPTKAADYVISDAKNRMMLSQLTGGGAAQPAAGSQSSQIGGAPAAAAAAGGTPQVQQKAFDLLAPEDQNIVRNFIAVGKPEEAVKHMADVLKPKYSSDGKGFVSRNGRTSVMPGSVEAFNSFQQAGNANTLAPADVMKNPDGTITPRTVAQVIAGTQPAAAPGASESFKGEALLNQLPPALKKLMLEDAKKDGKTVMEVDYQLPSGQRVQGTVDLAAPPQSAAPAATPGAGIGQTTAGKQQQESQGKFFGDTYADTQKKAMESNQNIGRYQRLQSMLDGVETGKFTGTTLEIKKAAKAAGIDLGVADNIAPLEAARALTSEMALIMRNPDSGMGMPGAMSDADRSFLVNMQPGIEATPEGRKIMIEAAIKMEQRKQEIAKIARGYKGGQLDNGFFEEVQRYADAHPLFEGVKVPASPGGDKAAPRIKRYNPATGKVE